MRPGRSQMHALWRGFVTGWMYGGVVVAALVTGSLLAAVLVWLTA